MTLSSASGVLQPHLEPVDLLPATDVPRFELVPYNQANSAARLEITTIFLQSQKKSAWNPATWWEFIFGPSQEEQNRIKAFKTFETALSSHQYRHIGKQADDRLRVLAILEKIFGPLDKDPAGEPFYNLGDKEIFNILETFYEYKTSFDRLTRGNCSCLARHIIHFLPTASAANPAISFTALSILNESIRPLENREFLTDTLKQGYRGMLKRTGNEFIRAKSCEGLSLLNVNPTIERIGIRCEIIKDHIQQSPNCKAVRMIVTIGEIAIPIIQIFKMIQG